jgi:hypothetical protein
MTKLTDKFPRDQIEWRIQQTGATGDRHWAMVLPYIQSRAVMDRLDAVYGNEMWQDEYTFEGENVLCSLSVYVPEIKQWISKQDGAPMTKVESFKGGISDALKRAAVKYGIGRYLYGFKGPYFVELRPEKNSGEYTHYDKDLRKKFWWDAPEVEGMYAD